MSAPKDMMGREIKVGDTIAYGLMVGRSANLAVYVVNEIVLYDADGYHVVNGNRRYGPHTAFKLKATKLKQTYGSLAEKPSTIAFMDRALVINESAAVWK